MKIEVGMHSRTRLGIGKVVTVSENNAVVQFSEYNSIILPISQVNFQKASFNPIDLIEKGDYVNGEKVSDILKEGILTEAITPAGDDGRIILKESIKSIVTKEQFEQMEYKLQ